LSWCAHDLEAYPLLRHSSLKIAFVPLLIGSYAPDMVTKWFAYGVHVGPFALKAHDPTTFQRGWPGFGPTHSLMFGVVVCLFFWKVLGSKNWGIAFLIGQWAHALTDTTDTVGTMLLFPWTHHFHLGAWQFSTYRGRMMDAGAYFSSLGCMWDAVWLVYGFLAWRVLTKGYFEQHVFPSDALWAKANRFLPMAVLLVLYRGAFFYGTSRWVAWTIWAHVIHHFPYDLSWGGPHWPQPETPQ